jgi:hypothetical protein
MAYREVSVIEVKEILRLWLAGHSLREVTVLTGADRKTVRRGRAVVPVVVVLVGEPVVPHAALISAGGVGEQRKRAQLGEVAWS